MLRILVFFMILLSAACGDNRIPSWEACDEQADAWCEAVGYAHTGCEIVYRHWCYPGNSAVTFDSGDQADCMEAIADLTTKPEPVFGYSNPTACTRLWANPPPGVERR